LVLEVFVGLCPEGMECCHEDDDCTNNRLTNLRWGTRAENNQDKVRNGRVYQGDRHHRAKVTADDVREMRRLSAEEGMTNVALATRFRLTPTMVGYIITRKSWKHV
jgi:hypothetical protein